MRKPVAIFAVLILGAACPTSQAEDQAVTAAYGAGVHGYYAGNYQQSHDTLGRVVAIGTDDPRVYYFRGLAALRLGRRDEALADFSQGADLEAAGWSIRTVSRSLERVQGPDRLLLERSRSRARLAIAQGQRPTGSTMRSTGADLSGPRYSGIGGSQSSVTEKLLGPAASAAATTTDSKETMDVPEPSVGPKAVQEPAAKPGPVSDSMNSSRRGRSDTQRDQIDAQNELRAAEATDVLDQREAMAERDAAAGDR
jgi:tetratricopeptide (TPR) repeat protein